MSRPVLRRLCAATVTIAASVVFCATLLAQDETTLEAFRTAKEAYHRDPAQAVKLFEEFIRTRPESDWTPQAYYWHAKSLESAKAERSQVIRAYTLFLEKYPNHDLCHEAAFAVADIPRTRRESKTDLSAALERYLDFVREYPASDHVPEAWSKIADVHRVLAEYDAALEAFGKVIEGYPRSSFVLPARMGRANTLYRQGNLDRATDCYQQLLDATLNDEQRLQTRMGLLDCHLAAGRLEAGLDQAAKIRVEADEKNFRREFTDLLTRLRLAGAYVDLRRFEDAVRELQAHIERFPDSETAWRAHLRLGSVHVAAGTFEKARAEYRLILSTHPTADTDDPSWIVAAAQYGIGYAFELEKRPEEAVTQYRLVIARFPRRGFAEQARERMKALGQPVEPRTDQPADH